MSRYVLCVGSEQPPDPVLYGAARLKGMCAECDRTYSLRLDGTIPKHKQRGSEFYTRNSSG